MVNGSGSERIANAASRHYESLYGGYNSKNSSALSISTKNSYITNHIQKARNESRNSMARTVAWLKTATNNPSIINAFEKLALMRVEHTPDKGFWADTKVEYPYIKGYSDRRLEKSPEQLVESMQAYTKTYSEIIWAITTPRPHQSESWHPTNLNPGFTTQSSLGLYSGDGQPVWRKAIHYTTYREATPREQRHAIFEAAQKQRAAMNTRLQTASDEQSSHRMYGGY
jgi:hypothetical protein